jgi:diguanylate cyclase (GGDEF)-like protein/PAS domain S-box-containing protein
MGEEGRSRRSLRERWGAFFARPEFEREADRLMAEALRLSLWLSIALTLVVPVGRILLEGGTARVAFADLLLALLLLAVGLWLLRRKMLKLVAGLTISLGWLLMTADILAREGLFSPNILSEIIIIFAAGLLVGPAFATLIGALSIGVNFVAVVEHLTGRLPAAPEMESPLTKWFILSVYILLAALFVSIVRRWLDASIQRSELSDHLYQTLMRSTAEGVVLVDLEGEIRRINPRGCALIGCQPEEALGRDFREMVGERYHALLNRYLPRVVSGEELPVYEIELKTRDGGSLPVEVSSGLVLDGEGRPLYIQNILRDVGERKRAERELRYYATHDRLTGLLNRAEFEANLDRAISRAQRERSRLALLFIDIDNLKKVNDKYGHAAADELLKAAAQRLAKTVRTGDVLARQSGDEFVVLIEPLHGLSAASKLAGRILAEIARPLMFEGQPIQVSCSIGIGIFPHDASGATELMQAADLAMYVAKRRGKNRASFSANVSPTSPD